MTFSLIPLLFEYADFDGLIAPGVMRWHRESVHAHYMDAINALLAPLPQFSEKSIEEILSHPELLPASIRDSAMYFGGGYANHQFFWKILGRSDQTHPQGALAEAIDAEFGNFDRFQTQFTERALDLKGSGWAFLSLAAPRKPELEIVVLSNNGSVLPLRKPGILVCDLWEHAYLDTFREDRSRWLEAYWSMLNWRMCETRYECLVAGKPTP
jgi:Fe-Mn family superoxide dismutase